MIAPRSLGVACFAMLAVPLLAQEFDKPITGKVELGVHTLKMGSDAAYTLRVEHKKEYVALHLPYTLQSPLVFGQRIAYSRDWHLAPEKADDYRFVIYPGYLRTGSEPYTLTLHRAALSKKPVVDEKGEFNPKDQKLHPIKAKANHLYVIEVAYADKNARTLVEVYEMSTLKDKQVLKIQAQQAGLGPVARIAYQATKDGDLAIKKQGNLFPPKEKGFTIKVWETEKPGPGEVVGAPVQGNIEHGMHRFKLAPDAVYVATATTDKGPINVDLTPIVVSKPLKNQLPKTAGIVISPFKAEEVDLRVGGIYYDPKTSSGPSEYRLLVRKLPVEAKPLLEVKDEIKATDPVYAGAPFRLHPVELKAGRRYVIDMIPADRKKIQPYVFLEDLGKPPMGGFRNIVDQSIAHAEDPGARLIFTPEKDGKYGVMAKGFNKDQIGPYSVIVRQAAKE